MDSGDQLAYTGDRPFLPGAQDGLTFPFDNSGVTAGISPETAAAAAAMFASSEAKASLAA